MKWSGILATVKKGPQIPPQSHAESTIVPDCAPPGKMLAAPRLLNVPSAGYHRCRKLGFT